MRQCRYSNQDLRDAVASSTSIFAVLPKLGLTKSGGNHRLVKLKIVKLGIDTSHLLGRFHNKGKHIPFPKKIPLRDILIENSSYLNSNTLRKRLIKEGILKDECSCCMLNQWMGKSLVCHLDHINGTSTDNRIENLRLLCPNCHSQTITYAGKNSKKIAV